MTIIRWKNRPVYSGMLNNFFENEFNTGFEKNNGYNPATNIIENQESFQIELSAPGRNKKDFQLQVENRVLSVSFQGQEKESDEQETFLIREFNPQGSFTRSFSLPKKVDAENIKAAYENGVLTITVPKLQPEPVLSKSIEIA